MSSLPDFGTSHNAPAVTVLGAGVAGLTAAFVCARRGAHVKVVERREAPGRGCSWFAGGMIAPWCEAENAGDVIRDAGQEALAFWRQDVPVATRAGSLVVAPARDLGELRRFAKRTDHYDTLDPAALGALEPDLGARFSSALYFPEEAHLEPRRAIAALQDALAAMPNVTMSFGVADRGDGDTEWIIDARGLAARDSLPDLRGVKGEMVVLRTRDVSLARPVRLVHPRTPVYIVPRPDHLFMVGATMIENEEAGRITARGLLELLGAAYVVHPAFGDAEVVETGCDLRPAFPDNVPRVIRDGRRIHINGLFRHGFCLRRRWRDRRPTLFSEPGKKRDAMQIVVNGTPLRVDASDLAALIVELDYDDAAVATAVNQTFVRRKDRATTMLKPDDAVEILAPRQGG